MKDNAKKHIAELLSSEDPDSRRRAAEDLSEHAGLAVVAALAAALNDENKGVRDAAVHTLLVTGGPNVARAIVEYIADDNIVTRNLAGELLHQLGPVSVPALLPYIQDTNFDVRKFAVDLLGLIGSPSVAPHVAPLLKDTDANVVASAVEALGNLRNPEVVPELINTFRQHTYAQAPVVEALGKIGGPQAAEFLLLAFNKAVSDGSIDPVTLCTIVEALGVVGDNHALIVLQARLKSVQGKLRNMLLHAIVRITERLHGRVALDHALTPDLLNAVKDDDPQVRMSAAKGLAGFPGQEVTVALIQCFGVSEELDDLLYAILEQRDNVVGDAIRLLEESKCPSKQAVKLVRRLAIAEIQKILCHKSTSMDEALIGRAFSVVGATWQQADEETRAAIVDTLFHLDGDKTIGFLEAIMGDQDPWLRMQVIEQLAVIEDRRVPIFVGRFLQDEDEMVREVAVSILESRSTTYDNFQATA